MKFFCCNCMSGIDKGYEQSPHGLIDAWKKIGEMFPGYFEQYKNRSEWVEDNWIEDKVEEITLGECIIR